MPPTPQAKGKIERAHSFWQKRLPPLFAAEHVSTLPEANTWIDSLRDHRNRHEIHREIRSTPQAAWNLAKKQGHCTLRSAPKCPWWLYVFSQRSQTRVGSDGRIAIGSQRLPLEQPPATPFTRCLHPDGSCSVLLHPPTQKYPPSPSPALGISSLTTTVTLSCFDRTLLSWFECNTTRIGFAFAALWAY